MLICGFLQEILLGMEFWCPARNKHLQGVCFLSGFHSLHSHHSCTRVFVVVQSLSHVILFATPWTAAHQASLPLTYHLPKFTQVHVHCIGDAIQPLILWCPLLLLPLIFPSIRDFSTFLLSQLFSSDDQNTGASTSASVLPTSIQDWFSLRLTGLISLLSKGLSGSSLLQHNSLKGSVLWCSAFFMVQLS